MCIWMIFQIILKLATRPPRFWMQIIHIFNRYRNEAPVTGFVRLCPLLRGWVSRITVDKHDLEQKHVRLAYALRKLSVPLCAFKRHKWRILLLQQPKPGQRLYSPS